MSRLQVVGDSQQGVQLSLDQHRVRADRRLARMGFKQIGQTVEMAVYERLAAPDIESRLGWFRLEDQLLQQPVVEPVPAAAPVS